MTDMPIRYGTTIVELARDLMAAAQPVTGTRSAGRVLVQPRPGKVNLPNAPLFLPHNWALLPVVNGAVRDELVFKVAKGPNNATYPNGLRVRGIGEPLAKSWWTVGDAGGAVGIISNIGGARHNLPADTVFRFDPPHPDFLPEATLLDPGATGGTDPTWLGGAMSMVQFESLAGASVGLDTFRSSVNRFPAVIFAWGGSEPGDGATGNTIDRGMNRVGAGSLYFKERFDAFIITSRADGDHARRNEGLKLLDDLTYLLTDRVEVDEQAFSYPTGVHIRARSRIQGQGDSYQQFYVYSMTMDVNYIWQRWDPRTFSDWLKTHLEERTYELDGDGNRKLVVSADIDMRPGAQ